MIAALSQGTLQRLPQYLIMLKPEQRSGRTAVTAEEIGAVVQVSPSQVRHDLTACGADGAEAWEIGLLIQTIEHALGYDDVASAVIVGAGQLGRALLSYQNYADYGVEVLAAFDANEDMAGQEVAGKPILSVKRMSGLCRRMKVHIGIITVPAAFAQEACDALLEGGVQAIWNFAPVHLKVPEGVIVKNEIIAVSLGELSRQLQEKRRND